MKRQKMMGLAMVLFAGVVFGSMAGLKAICTGQGASNALLLTSRFFFLALLVLPRALKDGNLRQAFRNNWRPLVLLPVVEGLTPLLLYNAYDHLASGLVMTVHYLYPIIVTVWCVVAFREKLSFGKLLCLILSLVGIVMTVDLKSSGFTVFGLVLTLLSAVTYAAYIVGLAKAKFRGITNTQIAFFLGVGCFCVATVYGFVGCDLFKVAQVTPLGWLSVAVAGAIIACGALCFILGERSVGAQVASIASTMEPLVSIAIGVLFLSEVLTWRIALGCLLILTAVVLLPVFTAKEEKKA